jgi:hypothetical protein
MVASGKRVLRLERVMVATGKRVLHVERVMVASDRLFSPRKTGWSLRASDFHSAGGEGRFGQTGFAFGKGDGRFGQTCFAFGKSDGRLGQAAFASEDRMVVSDKISAAAGGPTPPKIRRDQ